jgi:hypothetical protein
MNDLDVAHPAAAGQVHLTAPGSFQAKALPG